MPISKVWIYRLLLVCLCVCTVTDFSAEDKASGVIFCSSVHRRLRQRITHFVKLLRPKLPQKPKIGRIGHRAHESASARATCSGPLATRTWPVRWPIRPARWPRVGLACVARGQSPLTYLLKCSTATDNRRLGLVQIIIAYSYTDGLWSEMMH